MAQDKPFYLHDGDTVVFYGDSITEQGFYTAIVDLYVHTRFPQMRVKFYSAGIGGDRVTGGFAGPVDERLERDVFAHHPTVVTVMLGMNDGGYKAVDDATIATYTAGYEHILDSIRRTLPHARITLIGTSPYDEATRPAMFPGGYNEGLQKLLAVDQMFAKKYDAVYVDMNAPVFAALQRADAANHLAAEMLIPDRIHPAFPLHWIMAAALLKGWNAPSTVTSVTMDASALRVTSSKNTDVSGLEKSANGVTWREIDRALPLPLDNRIADINFMLQNSNVEQALNQETLKISNLAPGKYRLRIDDGVVAELTSQQLKDGFNLAELPTPMRGQGQGAMWLIRDYEYTQLVHTRLLVRDHDKQLPSASGDAEFTKFEELQQGLIDDAVQPKPHTFRLELAQ
jgi:lysophospholipase L1-like esterase